MLHKRTLEKRGSTNKESDFKYDAKVDVVLDSESFTVQGEIQDTCL
jgi:hypothetical protein